MSTTSNVNNTVLNNYVINPRNLTQYKAFRGVTDFSNIRQFSQYESGYSFLSVLEMPIFMTKLGQQDTRIADLNNSFKHILEYEFRGLDGLPDINADTYDITDGINSVSLINKVTRDTNVTVTMNFFEKSGTPITKYSELYLTGIHDPNSQAKTYHGLIKNGLLDPGPEKEVFTFLYYVTDNTMMRIEKAYLLTNCQLTKADTSIYNGTRNDIGENHELSVEFKCFPITGYEVDVAANRLLGDITGYQVKYSKNKGTYSYNHINKSSKIIKDSDAILDTNEYKYAIVSDTSTSSSTTDTSGHVPNNYLEKAYSNNIKTNK